MPGLSQEEGDQMTLEDYRDHGLTLRSCGGMRIPHRAHPWEHPKDGMAQCWGKDRLPADAEEKYCTKGCECEFCKDIRQRRWPRTIMCSQKWEQLPYKDRETIRDSVEG